MGVAFGALVGLRGGPEWPVSGGGQQPEAAQQRTEIAQ